MCDLHQQNDSVHASHLCCAQGQPAQTGAAQQQPASQTVLAAQQAQQSADEAVRPAPAAPWRFYVEAP